MLKNIKRNLKKEIKSSPFTYLVLGLVLLLGFFIRVYRAEDLLRFYYDQGRDALVIWKLMHEGKFFLIGPVTGLHGIFLGPFYYYLIAPFYLIGGGNPVYPAVFLAFLSAVSVFVLFVLGKQMHSKTAGLFAATVGAFSYYIFTHSRWLSNPNPILLGSLLLLYCLWKVVQQSKNKIDIWWVGISLFTGISLQLESASAFFYLPLIFVFAIWQRKLLPGKKILISSIGVFLLTLIPQILFNFRHDNILVNNFLKLLMEEKAFRGITKFILETRIDYFWDTFTNKLYPGWYLHAFVFCMFSFSALIVGREKQKKGVIGLLLIFLLTPLVFYLFFQGNFGNIYDYYLSGYFMPFILLFSIGLGELWKTKMGKILVLGFFITFFQLNGKLIFNYLRATSFERPISLEDQLKAIDWLYNDSEKDGDFNVDIYVPPVIPYAYDYLLLWQGKRCGENLCGKVENQVKTLYTLYEQDPPHPERLIEWLARQDTIGEVEEEAVFGQITVQRRKRI